MGRSLYLPGAPVCREREIATSRNLITPPATTLFASNATGTSISASGTPHALGTWQQLIATTSADADWLLINISGMNTTTADTRGLLSIAVGANPNEVAIISEIPAGYSGGAVSVGAGSCWYWFPVRIPKGSRITAALRSLIASDTAVVTIWLARSQGGRAPLKLVTLGADTANSRGTNPAVNDTYVSVSAATPQPFQGLIQAWCGGAVGAGFANATVIYTTAVGAAGAEVAVRTDTVNTTTAEVMGWGAVAVANLQTNMIGMPGLYLGHIPAGTRVASKISVVAGYRDVVVFGIPYS